MTTVIIDKKNHRFFRTWDDVAKAIEAERTLPLTGVQDLQEIDTFGRAPDARRLFLAEDKDMNLEVFDHGQDALDWIEGREGITILMVSAYSPDA